MKLLRYGPEGQEKPAAIDAGGVVRDISSIVPDLEGQHLSPESLAKIAAADLSALPAVATSERIGPCVARVGNFICIGLNYVDHAHESGLPIPAEPIVFNKAPSSIVGPNDTVVIPHGSEKTDWEVEIAAVIGKPCYMVEEAEALDYVAGYCVCNDVSERAFQTERGGQWTKGKSAPTFGPIGPWLVTKDEVGDVQNLGLWLDVNGERRQTGSTSSMIFSMAHVVSYLSKFMRLEAGDVITTGTPPGVGMGMKPPVYLKAGDTIALGIDRLGRQDQKVVAYGG